MKEETTPDEADTISRAQAGDTGAYELLYRRYVSPIYSLAFRMTGSAELAEDLTQEIFIRVWSKLPGFRKESAFFTWLYTLAVRLIVRKRSASGMRHSAAVSLDSVAEEPIAAPAGYDAADAWDVRNAVARLPARTRAAVVLFDIEGYSHREIAGILGIREGTSKALVHRGREKLRGELTA